MLMCIDIFGLNTLWDERYDIRLLHHIYNSHKYMVLPSEIISKSIQQGGS